MDILNHHFENPNVHFAESTKLKFNDWKTGVEKWKISLRFYIQNYIATKEQQKILIDKLNKYASENTDYLDYYDNYDKKIPPTLFDTSIYDSNRKMRCILSSKPRENRPLRLLGDATIQDIIISAFIPKDAKKLDIEIPKNEIVPKNEMINVSSDDKKFIELALEKGLFSQRTDSYKNWTETGWAFKNVLGEDGWSLFDTFSKLSPSHYDISSNKDFWDSIDLNNTKKLTMGSIKKVGQG